MKTLCRSPLVLKSYNAIVSYTTIARVLKWPFRTVNPLQSGKKLVFSIQKFSRAIVYRGLGKTTDAIVDLKTFIELETDPQQIEDAKKLLHDLEG